MKILLLGKNGQVGWELQRSLAPLGEVIALDSTSQDYCANFTDLSGLADTVRQIKPNIIVNAAAYTAVDKAESEKELAQTINADAVAVLAQETKLLNAWLVHYSTDYVFAGDGTVAWQETDVTGPLSVYGATKFAGEQAIQALGCNHLIFRTSWVYGARGNNFAKTMLRLAKERDSLTVINDQIGAPTGADLLADVTAHAIRTAQLSPELSGLYHLVAAGETSWHGYASFVIDYAQKMGQNLNTVVEAISPVPTSAFPTPAKRPNNSRLNTSKLQTNFALTLPKWQSGVARMLTEFLEK
ncbi:dTDP-4-dehydrorhamnose reductase [Bathymodiolus platifrons methanotrophic gill symbiont]|uniref:dTDP-4-dehydrorhamnose reductase n=1 Tax=Bathymodiolus platifrons methanotrophic gill symbiont TaxID=113268 RepID=UPI001B4A7EAF|nr:dTDP-4-dehydrorhamnose reductase [Bathymodiolus platifrons methanotrophic gill symbiont]GFO75787.1 dTDP-4-dehydrorhamnose reductase [Bathymodiolus platifrons methanotrophic gill symbiont]